MTNRLPRKLKKRVKKARNAAMTLKIFSAAMITAGARFQVLQIIGQARPKDSDPKEWAAIKAFKVAEVAVNTANQIKNYFSE